MPKKFFLSFILFFSSLSFGSEEGRIEKKNGEEVEEFLFSFFELAPQYLTMEGEVFFKNYGSSRALSRLLTRETTVKEIFEKFFPTYDWKPTRKKWRGKDFLVYADFLWSEKGKDGSEVWRRKTKLIEFPGEDNLFFEHQDLVRFLSEISEVAGKKLSEMTPRCSFFIPTFNPHNLKEGRREKLKEFWYF